TFEYERDEPFVDRILLEVGWRTSSDPSERIEARRRFHRAADAFVGEIHGEPECFVSTMDGDYWYHGDPIPFTGVTGVATSRVARKQGLASRATALALARAAERGSVVAGLGIFDQGFYDKLGFGTGGYDHYATIDPATLTVPSCSRTPVRLTAHDVAEIHAARLARRRVHGSVSLYPVEVTALSSRPPQGFGLGFRDEETGTLTHHLWVHTEQAGQGPYRVPWMSFSTIEQFVELLGLIRNLGDQVFLVWLIEPSGVQLQDFVHRPFRRHQQGRRTEFETTNVASANFQYRILDVERALSEHGEPTAMPSFTLRVTDPAGRYLHDRDGWQGVAGDYEVGPGTARRVAGGIHDVDLTIGTGALTRAWIGALPMGTIRAIGAARVSEELASELDAAFLGPAPHTDWLY
ncbi:MAG: GNAT family N-acetyltransferase, partial [Spirochaetota bacterium]